MEWFYLLLMKVFRKKSDKGCKKTDNLNFFEKV